MRIREMEIDDLEQVMPIEEALFSVPWTANGFFSFLLRDDGVFLVAEEDGKILGYCGAILVFDQGDVVNVGVRADRQRQGIARMLLDTLFKIAGERGVTSLYLEVRVSNQAAIGLYEGLGFQRLGVRKDYYEEPKEDAVVMCRSSRNSEAAG